MTAKVKGKKVVFVSVIVSVFALIVSGGAFGKIPEPDNIVYGVAREDAVTITLEVGGEQIASYTMGDNPDAGVFYILRVPMDSLEPPEPGTARPGDIPDIYIDGELVLLDPPIELGERGTIHRVDLGTTDVDTDDIPDEWERQIVDANSNDDIENVGDVLPEDDFDNDGFSNLRELLAGSHPVDTEDIPQCWADIYSDGDVDGEDLAIFAEEYLYGICPCPSDLDGNDVIDEWDFMFFCEDYGRTDCWDCW